MMTAYECRLRGLATGFLERADSRPLDVEFKHVVHYAALVSRDHGG